jgi:hypothetical protein
VIDEQLHVVTTRAELRHLQRQNSQTVIKVWAKTTFSNRLGEIAIGRRDDANVNCDVCACANPPHSSFLQNAE